MLCNVLRNLVSISGKTQKEIASELGLVPQRFNFYVTGRSEPDLATLVLLANYFNVSVDYLLSNEKEPTANSNGLSKQDQTLVVAYHAASPDDRAIIDNIVSRYTQASEATRLA